MSRSARHPAKINFSRAGRESGGVDGMGACFRVSAGKHFPTKRAACQGINSSLRRGGTAAVSSLLHARIIYRALGSETHCPESDFKKTLRRFPPPLHPTRLLFNGATAHNTMTIRHLSNIGLLAFATANGKNRLFTRPARSLTTAKDEELEQHCATRGCTSRLPMHCHSS